MKQLNENIFHQYNKWKKNYVRKENSVKVKINEFLSRRPFYKDFFSISDDETCVNSSTSVFIYDDDLIDGKIPFQFGKVDGSFNCSACTGLISLEGVPKTVSRKFFCDECSKLTSLKGAPKTVGNNFKCSHCGNLTSLEGAPEKVGGSFSCEGCPNLTSLEHLPNEINGIIKVDKRFEGQIPSDKKILKIRFK